MIKSVIGTEYAISTNQLDFLATETFGLGYIGEDGKEHPVYVIHRAPLGSHERFTAFLIEHYAGAFPVWLAPVQARIIPITDRVTDYAESVRSELMSLEVVNGTAGLRIDIDLSAERMQRKIRDAQTRKIPYMLVIGDKEAEAGTVAVRLRSGKDLGAMPLKAFAERIKKEAEARHDVVD
jgi:threonyl-tRNA synthetase